VAPQPIVMAAIQCNCGDITKITTADAFITPASAFLIAAALRVGTPAIESAAIIKNPIPPPK